MITKFQQFLEKALIPSQFRKYAKAFNRDRYKDVFEKYKEMYDGDKNAYRIYLPLLGGDNPIKNEVEEFLKQKGFVDINYVEGNCRFEAAKNTSKIGKILTKEKKDDLMKKFVEDPKRKAGNDLLVCISRHPYDIAGADTDREWTDCMTISSNTKHPRVKALVDRLNEIKLKLKEIKENHKKLKVSIKKEGPTHEENATYAELNHEENKLSQEMHQVQNNINNRREAGCNVKYLIQDVKQGSLISYLIKATDKNINKPLAVLNIKPFINERDKKDIILMNDKSMYGEKVPEFKTTVENWCNAVNLDKSGSYRLNPNLYDDGRNVVEIFKEKDYELMVQDVIKLIDQFPNSMRMNDVSRLLTKLTDKYLNKVIDFIDENDLDLIVDASNRIIYNYIGGLRPDIDALFKKALDNDRIDVCICISLRFRNSLMNDIPKDKLKDLDEQTWLNLFQNRIDFTASEMLDVVKNNDVSMVSFLELLPNLIYMKKITLEEVMDNIDIKELDEEELKNLCESLLNAEEYDVIVQLIEKGILTVKACECGCGDHVLWFSDREFSLFLPEEVTDNLEDLPENERTNYKDMVENMLQKFKFNRINDYINKFPDLDYDNFIDHMTDLHYYDYNDGPGEWVGWCYDTIEKMEVVISSLEDEEYRENREMEEDEEEGEIEFTAEDEKEENLVLSLCRDLLDEVTEFKERLEKHHDADSEY